MHNFRIDRFLSICFKVPVSTGIFCFSFTGMIILALLLMFFAFTAGAQECENLVKCYGENCYQQDTVRGYDVGQKASIPKMWLSSTDTNYYLNIVFTDTVSGENIKLHEPHDINFMFCCDEKSPAGHKYLIEESYYCNYSGCVAHKIPLSKYGRTSALYSYFLQNRLAAIVLFELDRKQAFRDGDMQSDGVFERISQCRLSEAEWLKLKAVLLCITTAK